MVRPKIQFQYCTAFTRGETWRDSTGLSASSPHLSATDKVSWTTFSSKGPGALFAYPSVWVSVPYQASELFIHAGDILLQESGGTPPSSIKLASYSYWLFTFLNKLLSISSVQGQGHIFGHPHKPKMGISPSQWDEEEVIKIQATCGEAREIPLVWNSEVLVTIGMWLWDPISRILHTWRGSMPGDSRTLVSRLTWPHQWNSLA